MFSGKKRESGMVLPVALVAVALTGIVSAGLFSYMSYVRRSQGRFMLYDKCRLAAQTGLEIEKFETKAVYERYYADNPSLRSIEQWFDADKDGTSVTRTSLGVGNYKNDLMSGAQVGGCSVTVVAPKVVRIKEKKGLYMFAVTYEATAVCEGSGGEAVSKSIVETVHFGLKRSRVFDYAYFVNNYGWFQGGGCHANGDIRANGDMHLDGNSLINGNAYAAQNTELGTRGDIDVDGRSTNHQSIDRYRQSAGDRTRPTTPTSGSDPDVNKWEMGYDGESELKSRQEPIPMPFISDLGGYKDLARELGGTIKVNGTNVVTAVYEGAGPSGDESENAPDKGCLILDGTISTIEIDGPVVVDRDVIIRGKVKGQGAIYSGRNIHIIGDINYETPPKWEKPDDKPGETAERNKEADLLTLAAKGNIVIGNPTSSGWMSNVKRYITPPFVNAYACDKSDEDIGYKNDTGGKFPGDYTKEDGLKKAKYSREGGGGGGGGGWGWGGGWGGWGDDDDGDGKLVYKGEEPSHYYDSLIGDAKMKELNPTTVKNIDAVLYNNHAIMGQIGSCDFNGALVCRDEALIYSGSVYFNWDIRIGSESLDSKGIDAFLYMPLSPEDPYTADWKALP